MADFGGSFLPTIKCSQCSKDIEISQMGEHVCSSASQPSPPPEPLRSYNNNSYKQDLTYDSKSSRTIPPLDTSAANRPYRHDEYTPLSLSPSGSISPMTPGYRVGSPFGRPLPTRSATAPGTKYDQPSPDMLSDNEDPSYSRFGGNSSAPMHAPREGGYGGFAKADPMFAPVSPKNMAGAALLQRMNTIAPGPFDVNNRRARDERPPPRLHQRQKSMKYAAGPRRIADEEEMRPNTSAGHMRSTSSKGSRVDLPRAPRKDGYGGFGGIAADSNTRRPDLLRPEDRSQTFPLQNPTQSYRRPSEPESRSRTPSNEPSLRPTEYHGARKPSLGPDLTRPLPPRGASFLRPTLDRKKSRFDDSPPVPSNLNLAAEFGIGNPYHTPSESQSSDGSGYSENSKASSRSSPPGSARPSSPRKVSDTTMLDDLMNSVQSSMAELRPISRDNEFNTSPRKNQNDYDRGMTEPREIGSTFLAPESPMDPVFSGRLTPAPQNPARNASPTSNSPTYLSAPKPEARRPTSSKGDCKGCKLPIKGKSISSADGRLTGRYHKACFCCTSCSSPFQTSTFYVINDAPYCEQHYHKLNGSVCDTCDRGIEGPYLESERKQKFHPACLTCADCKRTLRHDYFEMDGRVYCERDAFRRAQSRKFLGPSAGTSRMERRTTRLMMM